MADQKPEIVCDRSTLCLFGKPASHCSKSDINMGTSRTPSSPHKNPVYASNKQKPNYQQYNNHYQHQHHRLPVMFEFLERQLTYFLIPSYHLLQARLRATTVINAHAFLTPLSILLIGYGVSITALVCAVVEMIALVIFVFTYGVEGTVMNDTLPFLFSRLRIIVRFLYVAIASHVSPASKPTIYLESAFIARPAPESRPGLSLLHIPHQFFTFLFGEDYLASTILYIKTLPCRVGNYAVRQTEKKILQPCGRMLEKTKKDPILAFMFRVTLPLFAISVFWTSVVAAVFLACALDLATKMGNKHRGLFIEGILETEDVDITLLSIAQEDDSSSTLSIMDATLFSFDDGVFKVEGSSDDVAAVVEKVDEATVVVKDVVCQDVEEEVFEDAIEGVLVEEDVEEVIEVVTKEEVEVQVKEDVLEATAKVEISKEADEVVKMEEEAVVEKEAVVSAVEEPGPAVMGGRVGEKVLVLGELNGAEPPSASGLLEKKVGHEKVCAAGQTTRLTPFAAPFVPKFVRKPVPIPAPVVHSQSTFDLPPPPIPTGQSTPAHWAPARTVSIVLEAPRRRGGRARKATEGADGATASKGLSRKERHKKLMGLTAKDRS
ncbi:hypothetical protein D9613_005626 [Agrocybe pediades]|uniref:Uncharacterized protein n=1 Tax=Agrocybe pediades TaxID=84607 RepID=A0A8H4QU21_9AGAR|nr:hypothetical protein D9613_005626 [Agrocybe pediades]